MTSLDRILSNKQISKALIRLRGWAGWSALCCSQTSEDRFSSVEAHFSKRFFFVLKNISHFTDLHYEKINPEVLCKWNRFGFWNSCKRSQNFVNVTALFLMDLIVHMSIPFSNSISSFENRVDPDRETSNEAS